eukprot:CAMPEP_0177678802 /NCGR_PEP_ID=MMETSP0447-20121125/29208_1 /TAXON_ID=0 /ORGANISM="Stygamoeba regulata, Strain BSH-02190019" /LENGTH=60 /DNA_ID=CAMNT_0019187839 /DNA_START=43 /DNA_END=221 /DNA_ORIENTATION=+
MAMVAGVKGTLPSPSTSPPSTGRVGSDAPDEAAQECVGARTRGSAGDDVDARGGAAAGGG